uniref:Uncharacterized protein n=1 Tax=Anguilla anguilla TaxID=7936 RepID=A0A0E9SF26_ANGAN
MKILHASVCECIEKWENLMQDQRNLTDDLNKGQEKVH